MSDHQKHEDMTRKLPSGDDDRKALRLAETTDVSVRQAHDLIRKHGRNNPEVEQDAMDFKAEG